MKTISYHRVLCLSGLACATLLHAQVQEAWVARYNGPANGDDYYNNLAVDNAGNVYITGWSLGSATGFDYATVKYGPDGTQLWVARYDGPGHTDDYPTAISVDSAGNVYVTGGSASTSSILDEDFATVKYDANGNQLWVARYDGPTHRGDGGTALAVDNMGCVYVTGFSDSFPGHYATVKYDTNGNQLWVASYGGGFGRQSIPNAIVVDSARNVYVTGLSAGFGGNDYATVKYDANGHELRVARYNGPGSGDDGAIGMALDRRGNVYVTGFSTGAGTGSDFATVKYDPDGNELSVARYNGPGNSQDGAYSIALDKAGNVYVSGSSYGFGTGSDYATVKYDADGNELWVARYNGLADGEDSATGMALDGAGNVYVTGYSTGSGTGYDFATVKYDPSGNELWVVRYNGPDNGDDLPYVRPIALDSAGNVYVTGYSVGNGTRNDFVTVKYVQTPPNPWLGSPTIRPDGQFEFTLIGEAGRTYGIQVSTNLVTWTTLTNFVSATGTNQFTDATAPNFTQRFYRAVTQ